MDSHIIRYGIDRNYIPDWTLNDAIREVHQNFTDYGDYDLAEQDTGEEGHKNLVFKNSFSPEFLEYLKLGFSEKGPNAVGKHGEGLKMAALVFTRNDLEFSITHNTVKATGVFYEDRNLGECFGLEVEETEAALEGFTVQCTLPDTIINDYEGKKILPEEILFSYEGGGDLIDKPAGEVYVGGLYVCNLEGLKYAYNFHPSQITLDRDRKIPATFDVQFAASRILQASGRLEIQDLTADDTKYIDRLPEKIAKKLKPKVEGGQVVFRNRSFQAPENVKNILMQDPRVQKKVATLKRGLIKKRKPESVLKEFRDKHGWRLNSEELTDFNAIIKMAKDWKY